MTDAGFNFHYCTSIYREGNDIWRFCFERGWLVDGDICYIRDMPEQALLL
jgi:hypothetical protein